MAPTSELVVTSLEVLVVLFAAVMVAILLRNHRASGRTLREAARPYIEKVQGPLRLIAVVGATVILADFLLPPERMVSEVYHLQTVDPDTVKVTYGVCCTGGGNAACNTPSQTEWASGQPILIKRSALLDRCSVEPSPIRPGPCRCS